MKNKEVIQKVQQLYSRGVHSDDSRLKSRHIYSTLLTMRSTILVQQVNKKQKLSPWNYQKLPCVEMVEIDINECPCTPPSGCTILRSKFKLPLTLTGLYGTNLKSVSLLDRKPISEVDISSVPYLSSSKYTTSTLRYFLSGGYLYIVSDFTIKIVTVEGLFNDPIEAYKFENFCSSTGDCIDCMDYMELDFPIDGDLMRPLLQLTNEELLNVFARGVEDRRNDSKDGEQS